MIISHSPRCLKRQESVGIFKSNWPHYCIPCGGGGYNISGGDRVDYGSMTTRLSDEHESCEVCIERGICPRCYKNSISADYENSTFSPCTYCGFEYEITEGIPSVDCECWIENVGPHDEWGNSVEPEPRTYGDL